jgi:hypothetical protein
MAKLLIARKRRKPLPGFTNDANGIGHLSDPSRKNVAL